MDYKHSTGILTGYIKEMEEILSGMGNKKKIPVIELDILLDKTRNFYEMLLLLRKNMEEQVSGPIPSEPAEEVVSDPNTGIKPEVIPEIKETRKPVTDIPSFNSPVNEPPKEMKVPETGNKDEKILSDRFRKQSLNESISQSKGLHDLSSKLQSKPIHNISGAIGLNDKFAFIHELFRGDTNRYNETITVLNNASNFNEAYNYLIENFDWDMNSEPVQKILDLIRRKFIVNKNG